MKKQILPDGTIVLEGSPEELVALETGLTEDDGFGNIFEDDENGYGRLLNQMGIRQPRVFRRDPADGWASEDPDHLHLKQQVEEVRAWGERQRDRANHNADAEGKALKRVQEHQKAVDDALAANGVLERKLARAVKQGFDPEKKEPYKTSIENENGTTIFFRVLKSGPHEGKVAQHYNGGSLLHNGELDPGQYLENYVKAGVEPEDRIPMTFWGSSTNVIAPSEQEAQWAEEHKDAAAKTGGLMIEIG